MHAIKKWHSQRPLQKIILPQSPASSIEFMLSFMHSYLFPGRPVPFIVNDSHLQLHYFLPYSTWGLHSMLLWYRRLTVVLICWLFRVASCQISCVSHTSHSSFFCSKHMANQGWGRKGIPGFFDIYRDDVTEEVSKRDLLLAKTESINIGGSASVIIHFRRRQKRTAVQHQQ